jgi:hypothetical protein
MKMKMNENKKSRERGKTTRYYVDNEIVEVFGSTIGVYGISVYNALAKHANSQTQLCYPSYETIMRFTGIGRRNTVSKYLGVLVEQGLIEISTLPGSRNNLYRLLDVTKQGEDSSSIATIPNQIQIQSSSVADKPYTSRTKDSSLTATGTQRIKSNKEGVVIDEEISKDEMRAILDRVKLDLEERGIFSKKENERTQ